MHCYEDWRGASWTCKACGWLGLGELLLDGEVFSDLMEMDCPKCAKLVAVISFPTYAEAQNVWSRVPEADRAMLELVNARHQEFNRLKLKTPDQLPDLDADELLLDWDHVDQDQALTVIRHEGRDLWNEPAVYEGFHRFEEVLAILKLKYGGRLIDLRPTTTSQLYLYGDKIWASGWVNKVRASLAGRDGSNSD